MQTFVTCADENAMLATLDTAQTLDPKRLGKQRLEAKQIYTALTTGRGWIHHPATKMWAGCEQALALYGHAMCSEWIERGFQDSLREEFASYVFDHTISVRWPWWLGHKEMVRSHRSKLVAKMPNFYAPRMEDAGLNLPYLWPDPQRKGLFLISQAEWARRDEWQLADNWFLSDERVVGFD